LEERTPELWHHVAKVGMWLRTSFEHQGAKTTATASSFAGEINSSPKQRLKNFLGTVDGKGESREGARAK